jgi:hypothetical protein
LKKEIVTKNQDQDRKEKEDNQDLNLHNKIKEEINKYLKIEEIERNKKSRKKRKSKRSESMIGKEVQVLNHMIRGIEGIDQEVEASIKKVKINIINDVNINS